jgi:hypothetical protein
MNSCAASAITKDKRPKKTVSFSRRVSKRAAKEHHHFDGEQMNLMWYSKDELKALRKHVKKIMKDERLLEASNDVYRGLEVFANCNRVNRYAANVIPVLNMHWENRIRGIGTDMDVSTFACRLNRETVHQGIHRGAQDAAEAFEIYFDDCTVSDQKVSQTSYDAYPMALTIRHLSARMTRSACVA